MDVLKLPSLFTRLSYDKKETFLKLAILTCAAILCKLIIIFFFPK